MPAHLQREIEKLKKKVLGLGALVEAALQQASQALMERDAKIAEAVIQEDVRIDEMEVEIEEEGLKILALYHPVATDLRYVIAVIKLNNDLERIGDQAVNIAERARNLALSDPVDIPDDLSKMISSTEYMLGRSLDALINRNVEIAREVIDADDEIDQFHRDMFRSMQKRMKKDPDKIDQWLSILSISRQQERVADQVTNIAEDVIYMVDGEIVRHIQSRITD